MTDDWCGAFLLHGDTDLDVFVPWPTVERTQGNFEDGAHWSEERPKVGSYAFVGKSKLKTFAPARNSTLLHWTAGPGNTDSVPERLLKLNRDERIENKTYSVVVGERVLVDPGRWMLASAYLTKRSNLILAAKHMCLRVWIARYRGSFALVWSTDQFHMEQVVSLLTEHQQNEFFALPVDIHNAFMVINPIYVIGRFRQAWYKTFPTDRLACVSYMHAYLRRKVVPLKENT